MFWIQPCVLKTHLKLQGEIILTWMATWILSCPNSVEHNVFLLHCISYCIVSHRLPLSVCYNCKDFSLCIWLNFELQAILEEIKMDEVCTFRLTKLDVWYCHDFFSPIFFLCLDNILPDLAMQQHNIVQASLLQYLCYNSNLRLQEYISRFFINHIYFVSCTLEVGVTSSPFTREMVTILRNKEIAPLLGMFRNFRTDLIRK